MTHDPGSAPADVQNTLGGRLRTLRRRAGETQAAVAAAVGMGRAHLANVETNRTVPSRKFLEALAAFYGVPPDWLATGDGSPGRVEVASPTEAALLEGFRKLPENEAALFLRLIVGRKDAA